VSFEVELSFIFLKERIAPLMLAALLMGFGGIIILLQPTIAAEQQLAGLIGLISGVCSGWAYLQVRELSLLGEPGWRGGVYFSITGVIMASVWATLTGWHSISLSALPYLFCIGLAAMLAQLSMTRAYKVGNKFTVASLSYLTVVFSALSGMIFLGDTVTWQETFGMIIIVTSGILSSIRPVSIKKWLTKTS